MGAGLFHVGGGKIYGDMAGREGQTRIFGRCPDALSGFFYHGIWQTHDLKARQAVGNITFRRHTAALDAGNAQCANAADHFYRPFTHRYLISYSIYSEKTRLFLIS